MKQEKILLFRYFPNFKKCYLLNNAMLQTTTVKMMCCLLYEVRNICVVCVCGSSLSRRERGVLLNFVARSENMKCVESCFEKTSEVLQILLRLEFSTMNASQVRPLDHNVMQTCLIQILSGRAFCSGASSFLPRKKLVNSERRGERAREFIDRKTEIAYLTQIIIISCFCRAWTRAICSMNGTMRVTLMRKNIIFLRG
jgi:hypothetical protein